MSSSDDSSSRRGFLKALGRAGVSSAFALPAIAHAAADASQSSKTPGAAISAPPPQTPPPAPPSGAAPADTKPSDDAKALAEIVKRRYGAHLSDDDLKAVTSELDQRIQGGSRLRSTHLVNSDEPDATFHAGPEHVTRPRRRGPRDA